MQCEECGKALQHRQKRFCTIKCAAQWRVKQPEYLAKVKAHRMAYFSDPQHRVEVSIRQRQRYADPAARPWGQRGGEKTSHPASVRQARSAQIRATKPWLQGGNGRNRSWRQELLAARLGWQSEYVVMTGEGWLPHYYGIDVAEPTLKIAIEVGNVASPHKQDWYQQNGWTYLHFSNRMVETWMEGCLQMVSSTISRLQETTTTLLTASS